MVKITENWYAIYTRYRHEKKAYNELIKRGFIAFLPLKKSVKYWSDRKKIMDEPLIPSYIFVYTSFERTQEVLRIPGIVKFIYFSGKIATMPLKQMEDLQLLTANEADLELIDYEFQEGTSVIIKAGPFKGIKAQIVTVNNKKNIILSLKNLGYSIQIKTSIAYIEPIN